MTFAVNPKSNSALTHREFSMKMLQKKSISYQSKPNCCRLSVRSAAPLLLMPFCSTSAFCHDIFSLSSTLTSGVSYEERHIVRDSRQSGSFVGIGQPSLKAMANASLTPLPWLGFTGGVGLEVNGFGADAGHLKKYGATIIHEGKMALAEGGLEQNLGSWRLQETLSFGRSVAGSYSRTSDGALGVLIARDHTRGSINLRAVRTLFNTFALGAEFSQSVGYVRLGDEQSFDHDEYYRSTLGLTLGIIL